jgi:hypothetical protein
MKLTLGEPIDRRIPWVRPLHELDEAWATASAGPRMRRLRRGGERVGHLLRSEPQAVAVRTIPLSTLVYPTSFAFHGACRVPAPYVQLTHRCLLVQVLAEGELKNVLFNPTDYEAARETPFFRQLIDRTGEWVSRELLSTAYGQVDEQLRRLGLSAEDIDLIAFDHFHTQDLRPLLGSSVPDERGELKRPRFPNAYLLAPRSEWVDWDDLHPLQRAWFIQDGKAGVPNDRVVLTDRDLKLGDGCYLLRTPGHTSGNQTLFVHGAEGVFGCSENGTSADSWSPYESSIPGLRSYSRFYDREVVLNSNTPELAADQYSSMVLERAVVDRVPEAPAFVQMFPSSEVTPSWLAPGVRPKMVFGDRDSGRLQHRTGIPGVRSAAE